MKKAIFRKVLFILLICFPIFFSSAFAMPYEPTSMHLHFEFAPMLLRHVDANTDDSEAYLWFYYNIWGTLTAQEGDIVFDTLTAEQRALVDFPTLDESCVYYVPRGTAYHSTDQCYTLLRSVDIREATYADAIDSGLFPCSKCVSDDYYPN